MRISKSELQGRNANNHSPYVPAPDFVPAPSAGDMTAPASGDPTTISLLTSLHKEVAALLQ